VNITPEKTVEAQVRCGGQLHKIAVKKNGSLALLSHPYLTQADREVNKALNTLPLDDRPRCFRVLNAWKEGIKRDPDAGTRAELPLKLVTAMRELTSARSNKRGYRVPNYTPNQDEVRNSVARNVNRCIREAMVRFMDTVEFPGYYRPQVQMHYDDNSVRLSIMQKPTKEMEAQDHFDQWVNLRDWFSVYRLGLGRYGTVVGLSKHYARSKNGIVLAGVGIKDGKLTSLQVEVPASDFKQIGDKR